MLDDEPWFLRTVDLPEDIGFDSVFPLKPKNGTIVEVYERDESTYIGRGTFIQEVLMSDVLPPGELAQLPPEMQRSTSVIELESGEQKLGIQCCWHVAKLKI